MLVRLKLTNFRQHEDREIAFTPGLNCIRGANEAGKSSVIEAVGYALFGHRALREGVGEVVTWGKNQNTMRVELVIRAADTEYRFVRHPGGAEVYVNGAEEPFVVGQNEVSLMGARIMGADVNTASLLMVASQGGLRGILKDGPTATSTLIEKLANMDVIDRILEAASERLTLGVTKNLDEQLSKLMDQATNIEMPDRPDEDAHHAFVERTEAQLHDWRVELRDVLRPARDALLEEIKVARNDRARSTELIGYIRTLQQTKKDLEAQIADLPEQRQLQSEDEVRAQIAEAEAISELIRVYDLFRVQQPEMESIPRDEWTAKIKQVEGDMEKLVSAEAAKRRDVAVLKSQLVTSETCSFCGMDVSKFPDVQAKNQARQEQIDSLEAQITESRSRHKGLKQELDDLMLYNRPDYKVREDARRLGKNVDLDQSVVPARLVWVGPKADVPMPNIAAMKDQLSDIQVLNRRIMKANAEADALVAQHATVLRNLTSRIEEQSRTSCMNDVDFAALEARWAGAEEKVRERNEAVAQVSGELITVVNKFDSDMRLWQQAESHRKFLVDQIEIIQKQIFDMDFNNALVKKVRAARPIIGSKLWNLVLTSVSTIFSRMRGTTSLVERSKEGFTVNGKSINGLSGSTQDLLGLSVRTALIKTFVPSCPFVVLDEAAAACDEERAVSLISLVATSGFTQVLYVTHEDISESVMNNLITL